MLLSPAAVLVSLLAVFPTSPTITTFHARDFGGRPAGDAIVWSMEGRMRVQAFGRVFVYGGKEWYTERPVAEEDSGAVAFLALFEPEARVVRADAAGRPLAIVDVPAGPRRARIEYHYDAGGLAAANVVFADGSGFQFRRASVEPGSFAPSDFDPPKRVAPPASADASPSAARGPDPGAVERLFALTITDREQLAFERAGGVGRFRPKVRR